MERLRAIFGTMVAALTRAWRYWMEDIGKRKSTAGKAASIGVGVFALCCACSVGYGAVRGAGQAIGLVPTNTPTPAPTVTPAPTNTAVPTSTLAPTLTPIPTDTPAPTSTPVPTDTPEPSTTPLPPTITPLSAPSLTTDERRAVDTIAGNVVSLGRALNKIGELAQAYEDTDTWKVSMVAEIVRVRLAHQDILALKVPPKIGALRAAVLNATADCSAAMDKLVSGIDRNNATDLRVAGDLMRSCGEKIKEVQPELDALD